jgi:hypothetical protein
LLARYYPERIERRPHRIDFTGAALLTGGVCLAG